MEVLRVDGSPALDPGSVFLNTTSTKSFATAGALNSIACAGKSHVKCTHFFSRDADHQCVMYNSNDLHAPQNSSLNNKALKNVGRKWYAWFVIKNKSLCRKRILVSFAEATQPFRPRPKILRFLLGLRRSSSCGRDCADGLLEVVCMATAFISRDPGRNK